jgi:hypothetical protein
MGSVGGAEQRSGLIGLGRPTVADHVTPRLGPEGEHRPVPEPDPVSSDGCVTLMTFRLEGRGADGLARPSVTGHS